MKTSLAGLVLACASWGAAAAAPPPPPTDYARLQGAWRAHTERYNGSTKPVTFQYVFQGDEVTFTDETGKAVTYAFTLDPASRPKLMALRPPGQAPVSVAYELAGDALTIVVAPPGKRPADLTDHNDQEVIACTRERP